MCVFIINVRIFDSILILHRDTRGDRILTLMALILLRWSEGVELVNRAVLMYWCSGQVSSRCSSRVTNAEPEKRFYIFE